LLSVLSVIGLYVGIRLRTKISPNFFKMLIFIVLLVLALKIGHSGLIKL
ncbi:TPA: sulfite exporter TauE/SafE family protein, partial [Neisseria meningitidis]